MAPSLWTTDPEQLKKNKSKKFELKLSPDGAFCRKSKDVLSFANDNERLEEKRGTNILRWDTLVSSNHFDRYIDFITTNRSLDKLGFDNTQFKNSDRRAVVAEWVCVSFNH